MFKTFIFCIIPIFGFSQKTQNNNQLYLTNELIFQYIDSIGGVVKSEIIGKKVIVEKDTLKKEYNVYFENLDLTIEKMTFTFFGEKINPNSKFKSNKVYFVKYRNKEFTLFDFIETLGILEIITSNQRSINNKEVYLQFSMNNLQFIKN